MNNTRHIKTYIGVMMLAAVVGAGYAGFVSHALHVPYVLALLTLAAVSSRLKVKLPGINGNMSVNLPFLLTAVVNLSSAEAVVVSCVSTAVQCWPTSGPTKNAKFNPQQMAFNLSMMAFASSMASLFFHAEGLSRGHNLGLVLATATLFLGQTAPVAGIVAISEAKAAGLVWWNVAHLAFPYYVVSAGVTSMVQAMSSHLGWGLALAVFPVMYFIHRSYQLYFGRIAETLRPPMMVRAAGAGA